MSTILRAHFRAILRVNENNQSTGNNTSTDPSLNASPLSPALLLQRCKHQVQTPNIQGEMILRLRQNPLAVLPSRKLHIKLEQDPGRQSANLHVRQLLADAAERAHGEGRESVFVLDQFWLRGPAGGDEGGGGGVGSFVCGCQFFRGIAIDKRKIEVLPRPITYCGIQ